MKSYLDELKVMDPHGVVQRPDHLVGSASMRTLAKDIAAVLARHYAGWNWGITVDERGGLVHIFALLLSGDMGYTLALADVQADVSRKCILLAGGEILERFSCRPGPFNREQWRAVRRGPTGVPIPDISDKHAKMRKKLVRRRALAS